MTLSPRLSIHRILPLPFALLLLLSTACQGISPALANASFSPGSTFASSEVPAPATPTAIQDQVSAPSPTLLVLSSFASQDPAAQPGEALPSPAPDPLRIVFPTPGRPPVSAWRPALYPVPWAPTPYDHFYFARPIAADEVNWPLADYRYGGAFFADVVHSGVDIPAPLGTPVLAAGPGKVTWAGYGLYYGYYDLTDPYGLAVAIRHDFGFQGQSLITVYGHLDRIDVVKGQRVETGDVLGLSGQTGKVTGPHLHFEVRLATDGIFSTRNPELWLVPPQGWGVLAGRVTTPSDWPLEGQLVSVRSRENGQVWKAKSYVQGLIVSDPYYQENLVISDLLAGRYDIEISYLGRAYVQEIQIQPGLVSYFTFRGRSGFSLELPPPPGADFAPSP